MQQPLWLQAVDRTGQFKSSQWCPTIVVIFGVHHGTCWMFTRSSLTEKLIDLETSSHWEIMSHNETHKWHTTQHVPLTSIRKRWQIQESPGKHCFLVICKNRKAHQKHSVHRTIKHFNIRFELLSSYADAMEATHYTNCSTSADVFGLTDQI